MVVTVPLVSGSRGLVSVTGEEVRRGTSDRADIFWLTMATGCARGVKSCGCLCCGVSVGVCECGTLGVAPSAYLESRIESAEGVAVG
jgi:hypothetical protein